MLGAMTLGHAVKASAPLIQAELYKRRPNEVCVVTDFANILAIKKKVSHIAFALAFLDRAALPQRLFAADKIRRTDFGICFIPCAESHCFVRAISRINRWQFTVDGLYNVESEEKINIRHGILRHTFTGIAADPALRRGAAADAGIDIASDQYVRILTFRQAWTPVWNAAVHSNTIGEHGGYLSHTLWCVLNRFFWIN
jgi:hypothetical protein